MDQARERKFGPAAVTLLASLLAGVSASLWANHLDPGKTGDSIPIIPVIFSLSLVCTALFAAGVIGRRHAFGPHLILASVMIFALFFVSRGLLRSIF